MDCSCPDILHHRHGKSTTGSMIYIYDCVKAEREGVREGMRE